MNKKVKRNMRFLLALLRHRLERIMMYKISFFGALFADGTLFVIQVLAFRLIYAQVDTIGHWGEGEMMVFIGTFSLVNALNMVIYFFGIIAIPELIQTGQMDLYLTKPVSPLFRITFEKMDFGSIPLIFLSIGIITYGIRLGTFLITPLQAGLYIGFVVIMTVLWYDLELILRTVSFFVISAKNLSYVEAVGLELCMKIPGIAFQKGYKVLFYFILPYGIIATIPTEILSGAAGAGIMVYGIAIVFAFTVLALAFWKAGVRRYNSASS